MSCEGRDSPCSLGAVTEGTVGTPVPWASTHPSWRQVGVASHLPLPSGWWLLNAVLITRLDLSCLSLGIPSRCLLPEPRRAPPLPAALSPRVAGRTAGAAIFPARAPGVERAAAGLRWAGGG